MIREERRRLKVIENGKRRRKERTIGNLRLFGGGRSFKRRFLLFWARGPNALTHPSYLLILD
jgi:hypothetical protein